MEINLSRGLALLKDTLLVGVFGTFAARNAGKDVGEHTLPAEFLALGTMAAMSVYDALNKAIEAGKKGDWLNMVKNYTSAATALVESAACGVAATHGDLAKTVAGVSNDVAKQVAPDGFKVVFGLAALASAESLIGNINKGIVANIGNITLDLMQVGINVTQCVEGIQKAVVEADKSWGYISTGLSALSSVLRIVGFFRADAAASRTAQSAILGVVDAENPGTRNSGEGEKRPLMST